MDETSIKSKGTWTSLDRAGDSDGNTLSVLVSSTRDAEAAQRFFVKALHSSACLASQELSTQEQLAQPPAEAPPARLRWPLG